MLAWWSEKRAAKALTKHAGRVQNKRAYAPDRWESIKFLEANASEQTVDALLGRFAFAVDPGITDQEEKDAVVHAVVSSGELAMAPLQRALRRLPSVSWPLKCLERLVDVEAVTAELLHVLSEMDTDYERDPSKKIEVLSWLERRNDARIVNAVMRFLEDANETARFHAVGAIAAQSNSELAKESLFQVLAGSEESGRVRERILETCASREWKLTAEIVEALSRVQLPNGLRIDKTGRVHKSK